MYEIFYLKQGTHHKACYGPYIIRKLYFHTFLDMTEGPDDIVLWRLIHRMSLS